MRSDENSGKVLVYTSPPGACARPLGVLSITDICLSGELIPIFPVSPGLLRSFVALTRFVFIAPLAGDELKNKGEDEGKLFC